MSAARAISGSSVCASEPQLTKVQRVWRLAFGGIFELLLENWRSSADPLPFQRNIYFDTVGEVFPAESGSI